MARDSMFIDDFFEDGSDSFKYLSNKEKPYSPNNTVYYYLAAKTYVDKSFKKSTDYTYSFIKIARTFSLWEEEVKLVFNDELTKESYSITNNMITVPMTEDLVKSPKKWRDFELTDDAIIFSASELKEIQLLANKNTILKSINITYKNRKFLYWLWSSGAKSFLPTDIIYASLFHASRSNTKHNGLPIIWDSSVMKKAVGGQRQGYIKAVLMDDLWKCNGYNDDDFDFYPITVSLENGKSKTMGRKQIASYFRRKILLIA